MSTQTNIRIGGAGKWAGDASLPTPTPKALPVPQDQQPEKPIVLEQLPHDNLEDLPKPRSYQEILDARREQAAPVARPKPVPTVPLWAILVFASVVLALLGSLSALMVTIGNRQVQPSASSIQPSTAAESTAQATTEPSVAPDDTIAAGAVLGRGTPDEATVVNINSAGAYLAKREDGAYAIGLVDPKNNCIPNFWSPPVSWNQADTEAKFNSESTTCYDLKGTTFRALGWWGDTNWVFFTRPKVEHPDDTKADDWDKVWVDVTWYGGTLDEIRAIQGVKDYAQPAPAPAVPTTPAVPAHPVEQQPVYVPPPPTETPYIAPTQCAVAGIPGEMVSVCGDGDLSSLEAQAKAQWLQQFGGNIGVVGTPSPQVRQP